MATGCNGDSGSDLFFKILAVVSPVLSSIATGCVTYFLTDRSKKTEYLYQHRIAAFKLVYKVVTDIKRFAIGRMALEFGAETTPFFDEPGSPLGLREDLAKVREENDIFLTEKSRQQLDSIDSSLAAFASAVLSNGGTSNGIDYSPLEEKAGRAQKVLYEEIGLPKA